MADTHKELPAYRRLYEILRKQIVDGVYHQGDLLPSENEICTLHNIARPTVRRALDALVNDGYIHKQQGKGSIVNPLPKGIGILSIKGTTSAIGGKHLKTKIIVKPHVTKWDADFYFPVPEEYKNSGCIYLERLRLVNDKPVFYDVNFIPNINLPRFCSRTFEDKSLFDILREAYQIEIVGGEQRIRAVRANHIIGEYLQVEKNFPVLYLDRKIDTNRIGFSFYSTVYCNTENHFLQGTF